jgi:hypothetical protein
MNSITSIKPNYSCSHCKTKGHKIDQCTHKSVSQLIEDAESLTIFNYLLYPQWATNKGKNHTWDDFFRHWLKERSLSELKILGYKCRITTTKKLYIEMLPVLYHKICITDDAENKLSEFSTAKLKKCLDHLYRYYKVDKIKINNSISYFCKPAHMFPMHLLISDNPDVNQNEDKETKIQKECPICFIEIIQQREILTNCKHEFCSPCIMKCMRVAAAKQCSVNCPLCRTRINKLTTSNRNIYEILQTRYCTKIIPQPDPIVQQQARLEQAMLAERAIYLELQRQREIEREKQRMFSFITRNIVSALILLLIIMNTYKSVLIAIEY